MLCFVWQNFGQENLAALNYTANYTYLDITAFK